MNRKMAVSLGVIALLLGFVIIRNMKKSSGLPDFSDWKGSPSEIIFKKGDKIVSMKNRDGKWLIGQEEFPADSSIIQNIENTLKKMVFTDMVSKQGFYEKYDLATGTAYHITLLKDGNRVRELLLGKKSSTNRHTYVRIDERPEIYLVSETFETIIDKSAADFRDKKIFAVKKDDVTGFDISFKLVKYSFKKTTEEKKSDGDDIKAGTGKDPKNIKAPGELKTEKIDRWVCRGFDQVKFSNDKVYSLLALFSPLSASDFPGAEKKAMGNPDGTFILRLNDKAVTVDIFSRGKDGGKNRYFFTSPESPYVFSLEDWQVKRIFMEDIEGLKE